MTEVTACHSHPGRPQSCSNTLSRQVSHHGEKRPHPQMAQLTPWQIPLRNFFRGRVQSGTHAQTSATSTSGPWTGQGEIQRSITTIDRYHHIFSMWCSSRGEDPRLWRHVCALLHTAGPREAPVCLHVKGVRGCNSSKPWHTGWQVFGEAQPDT